MFLADGSLSAGAVADTHCTPLVLIPACNRMVGDLPYFVAFRWAVMAVRMAGALPVVIPGLREDEIDLMLSMVDGILLTGSPSNVHPCHYGEKVDDPVIKLDIERDSWTLPLIRKVVSAGMPLLSICRGTQEVNVALGGSLYQSVHKTDGLADHRADDKADPEHRYGPAHDVYVNEGGVLDALLGMKQFAVNSVHEQGVKQLAPGLRVEAYAPDGLVEAFSIQKNSGFSLCVQWHPEWKPEQNPVSMKILQAFGSALMSHAAVRLGASA